MLSYCQKKIARWQVAPMIQKRGKKIGGIKEKPVNREKGHREAISGAGNDSDAGIRYQIQN
jgi:hypothetical protein